MAGIVSVLEKSVPRRGSRAILGAGPAPSEGALDRELAARVGDLAPVMMAYVDATERYRYVNRAYAEGLGRSPASVLGRSISEVLGPRVQAMRDAVDGALAGEEQRFEMPIEIGDERRWVAACLRPDQAEDGTVKGFLSTMTDITERMRTCAQLEDKERLLDVLFTQTLDSVVVLDANYDFVRVNEAYARACGRPVSEFLGLNHFELYPSDAKNMFDSVVASKKPLETFARPFRFPDHPEWGTTYWDWTLVPVIDDADEVVLLVFTLRDVTKQKRAELELARHRDELQRTLEERTHEVELLHSELRRKERLAALGQLLATVGHELRNPLGAVQASLELIALRLEGAKAAIATAMARAERNIQRCNHIIEELLDFSRAPELRRESTAFDEWLCAIMSEQELPEGTSCKLVLGADCVVELDRDRIRRCVTNVVANAVDAMREQSGNRRLSVETRRRDGRLEMRFTDTGVGITADQLERIFEPLYSTKTYGVGLGLPMVRQIMRRHGGDVEVDSVSGEGTTVTLWLPVASES